jgi:uncharacterized protein YndB with AHSA1/START domain
MPADQLRAVFGVLADPTRRAPQIIIVRRFDAPREPVFRAHIEPDPLASCLDPGAMRLRLPGEIRSNTGNCGGT